MELTARRWLLLALAGGLGMATLGLTWRAKPEPPRSSAEPAEREDVRQLRRELLSAVWTLARLERETWLRARLAEQRAPSHGRLIVVADPAFAPADVEHLTALADSVWSRLPSQDSSIRVVVAAVTDMTGSSGDRPVRVLPPELSFSAPGVLDDVTCLVTTVSPHAVEHPRRTASGALSAAGTSRAEQRGATRLRPLHVRDENRMSLLGPCGWYGAFGLPGPTVRTWLLDTEHRMALNGPWLRPASDSAAQALEWTAVRQQILARRGAPPSVLNFGLDAIACARGRPARCAQVVLRPAVAPGDEGNSAAPAMPWARSPIGAFQAATGSWLADLLAAMGPGQFRQFWQSPLEPELAFAAAFGEPLGQWTMRWARARIGTPELGPMPSVVDVLSALVWVALAGAGVGWARRRREAL